MLDRLTFLSLASLVCLTSGCIIVDDDSGDSGNATENATTNNATGTTETPANTTTANTGDPTEGDATAADDTSTAGQGGACGWGQTGDVRVPEGYVCGGDGEDPDGMFAQACPDQALEVGAACGDISGVGCCDGDGNVWFCGSSGGDQVLALDECDG